MNHSLNPNADLSKVTYITELYTDQYRTLCQSIMYRLYDERERHYWQSTINPNLELKRRDYYDSEHKIVFSEVFIWEKYLESNP